jgi:hypothetical protein
MGYRGLLLNDPYKIDSMVWMSLMIFSFVAFSDLAKFPLGYIN